MKFKLFPYHHIRWGGAGQIFARTLYKPINELQSLNAFWRSADAQLILGTRHCYGWLTDISPIILSLIELVSAFTHGHEGWFLIQAPDFYSSSRQTQKVAAQSMSFSDPWMWCLRLEMIKLSAENGFLAVWKWEPGSQLANCSLTGDNSLLGLTKASQFEGQQRAEGRRALLLVFK